MVMQHRAMNKWYEIYSSRKEWHAQKVDSAGHNMDVELYKFRERNFNFEKKIPQFESVVQVIKHTVLVLHCTVRSRYLLYILGTIRILYNTNGKIIIL